jgi:G3E family GTPase
MKLISVCGFLASGKTTLILEIAKRLQPVFKKMVIIENEIGQIGIDDKYLRQNGLEVQELFGGCICCTLSSDLLTTLEKVQESFNPGLTILEATGVARPDDLSAAVSRYSKVVEGNKVLTLVDGVRYEDLMMVVEPLITAQIEAADIIAINKIDVMKPEEISAVEKQIRELNGTSKTIAISADKDINLDQLMGELS